jgi:DNA-binding GntR family transcriptional regulator
LALALAADVLGDDERAQDVYQQLKRRLVGGLAKDGWSVTEERLRELIAEIERGREGGRGA